MHCRILFIALHVFQADFSVAFFIEFCALGTSYIMANTNHI